MTPHERTGLSVRAAAVLMTGIAMARGTSFLMSKDLLASMPPLSLLGLRFLIAFAVLFAMFRPRILQASRRERSIIGAATALGVIYFACMASELTGLRLTSASTCSLIENSAVAIVPLAAAALARRPPSLTVTAGACFTFAGICFVVLNGADASAGQSDSPVGVLLCAMAALTYAGAIIATDRLSKRYDPIALGVLYVGVLGAMGSASSLLFEVPSLPASGGQWVELAVLALLCTAFGFAMQPVAQKPLSPEAAGIICALNPLTTSVVGWTLAGAAPGAAGIVGACMIIAGIALPSLIGANRKKPHSSEQRPTP